jgi:hypothetical protein
MLDSRARIVLDTLLPSQAHPQLPCGVFDAGFDSFYQDFAVTGNAGLRQGFRLGLFAAIWISPLLIGRIPPITLYQRETRERALAAMETSSIYALRQMMVMLKIVVSLCYGANRTVRDAVGYPRQHDDPLSRVEGNGLS